MRTHLSGSHCLYSAFQTGERRCQSLFLGTARDPRPPPPGSPSRAGAPETGAQPSEGCRRTWASRRGLRGAGVFAEWERGHSHGRSSASFQAPPHARQCAGPPGAARAGRRVGGEVGASRGARRSSEWAAGRLRAVLLPRAALGTRARGGGAALPAEGVGIRGSRGGSG